MNTKKRNIVLANIDSVTNLTYSLCKQKYSCPLSQYELKDAYAISDRDAACSTVGFFLISLRNNDEKLDSLRKICWIANTPNYHLLKEIKEMGYQTIFASDWPYSPLAANHTFKMNSEYTEWLYNNFDLYIDSQQEQRDCYDIKRLLKKVEGEIREPYFLVVQVHDTHIPFRSKGVNNWNLWGAELNKVLAKYELSLDKLPTATNFDWRNLSQEDQDTCNTIFQKARGFQVDALKYTLDAFNDFIDKQDDVLFHLIGDHPTFLGEVPHFGNPSGLFNIYNSKKYLRTMWLTNQKVARDDKIILSDFYPMLQRELFSKIHESAYVDRGANIGKNVSVWHFSHIREDATIEDDVSIGQNVYIGPKVVVGTKTRIQNNVFIPTGVTLGHNCFIGPSVVFTNDKYPPSEQSNWLETIVEDKVSIGANSTIVAGVRLGEGCLIGAGSVITKDIPPYTKAYGNPAREVECLK